MSESEETSESEKCESEIKELIGRTVGNQFKILKVLGKGSFGICFEGLDTTNEMRVALKIEKDKTSKDFKDLVDNELKMHQILNGSEGIPKLFAQGMDSSINKHVIVMELLGEDLDKLYHNLSKKFSIKTVLMLAQQMIARVKTVHQKCLIHRDLKPENFLIGLKGEERKKIYLTDFGLVEPYYNDESGQHLPCIEKKALSGTVRFCSVNAHNAQSMSRRDDLESIAYILLYFLWGSLPWDGWQSIKEDLFYNEVKLKKESILQQNFDAIPLIIKNYLNYCRLLNYEEIPDYDHWMNQFYKQRIEYNFVWDNNYDWILIENN